MPVLELKKARVNPRVKLVYLWIQLGKNAEHLSDVIKEALLANFGKR